METGTPRSATLTKAARPAIAEAVLKATPILPPRPVHHKLHRTKEHGSPLKATPHSPPGAIQRARCTKAPSASRRQNEQTASSTEPPEPADSAYALRIIGAVTIGNHRHLARALANRFTEIGNHRHLAWRDYF